MPKRIEIKPPLQIIREAAGFDPPSAAGRISERLAREIAPGTVVSWERRGTRNVDYIEAMSCIYHLPPNVISEAARPRENKYCKMQLTP